ncbi:hypothetical protein CW304_10890 [Bacillus sp. UFRGS-B20]|nr:hypothetical protein CW304_10890 [Bacillus sp. UFRGS-B20]
MQRHFICKRGNLKCSSSFKICFTYFHSKFEVLIPLTSIIVLCTAAFFQILGQYVQPFNHLILNKLTVTIFVTRSTKACFLLSTGAIMNDIQSYKSTKF